MLRKAEPGAAGGKAPWKLLYKSGDKFVQVGVCGGGGEEEGGSPCRCVGVQVRGRGGGAGRERRGGDVWSLARADQEELGGAPGEVDITLGGGQEGREKGEHVGGRRQIFY